MFSIFKIGWRYLRSPHKEKSFSVISLLSFMGISLGVAVLIVVMAVMNGFKIDLMERILGINGHITIQKWPDDIKNYQDIIASLQELPEIVAVAPMVQGQVMASSRFANTGSYVRAVRPEDLAAKPLISNNIISGDLGLFSSNQSDYILIGKNMADKLGVVAGQEISLISPRGNITVLGNIPRSKRYKIAAIFNAGMYEYDAATIFMPFAMGQTYFKHKNAATAIEIMLEDAVMAENMVGKIQNHLIDEFGNFRVYDWQRSNAQFFNAINVQRNVMFFILACMLLIASLNMISSLVMLVQEKSSSIAILRTMGASRAKIIGIFFMCGAYIGIIGTICGLIIGVSFALNIDDIRLWLESLSGAELFAAEIYFLSTLPAKLLWVDVAQVVATALGISFATTLYPAWKASRTDPAEALRYS